MPFFPRSDRSARGPRRRRGDREDAAPLAFEVHDFEFVSAGGDLGLLRLSGAWSATPERAVPLPIEVEIQRDGESARVEVVPDPTTAAAVAVPAGEPWRGAFMVGGELAEDPRADFALVAGGEVVASLPRPADWQALEAGAGEPEAEPVEDEVLALELSVEDVAAEHVARDVAQHRPDPAAELALVAAMEARVELDAARAEAEAAVAEARAEVERERVAREAAEAERDELRRAGDEDVAGLQAAESALRTELDDVRGELEREREAAGVLRAELDQERAARERERAEHEAALEALGAELERARDESAAGLEALRGELEAERASAAEARAAAEPAPDEEAARKLAAVHEHLQQARQELELERRRRLTIEEELHVQVALERQLRGSLAGQEAERAAAEAHVARRVRAAERRREAEQRGDGSPAELADDFLARLEQAKKLSESA